jgi:hypothetical protein
VCGASVYRAKASFLAQKSGFSGCGANNLILRPELNFIKA